MLHALHVGWTMDASAPLAESIDPPLSISIYISTYIAPLQGNYSEALCT